MEQKLERFEERLRAVEGAAIETACALKSISETLERMSKMFEDSIGRVENVNGSLAIARVEIDQLKEEVSGNKKILYRVAAFIIALLLAAGGVNNLPEGLVSKELLGDFRVVQTLDN